MQTFIPYPDFKKSFEVLDKKRVSKQIIETSQLLDAIFNLPTKTGKVRSGFLNHPALIMWKNNPGTLLQYFETGIIECESRGILTKHCRERLQVYKDIPVENYNLPIWFGDEKIHASHRFRLLKKGFEEKLKYERLHTLNWYLQYNWAEIYNKNFFNQEYCWPIIHDNGYSLTTKISKLTEIMNQQLLNNQEIQKLWQEITK